MVLLVVAACGRRHSVTGASGAPTARGAMEMFLAAARAQDYDAFARAWGSANGPALGTWSREEREQRGFILMKCLRHDSYQILTEMPSASGERIVTVELHLKDLTASSNFTAVQGPGARWYVSGFEPKDLQSICVSK
jgi:hypothetical protein